MKYKPGNRYKIGGALAARLIATHPDLSENDALARLLGGKKPPSLVVRVASTGFATLTATWSFGPPHKNQDVRLTKLAVVIEGIDLRCPGP